MKFDSTLVKAHLENDMEPPICLKKLLAPPLEVENDMLLITNIPDVVNLVTPVGPNSIKLETIELIPSRNKFWLIVTLNVFERNIPVVMTILVPDVAEVSAFCNDVSSDTLIVIPFHFNVDGNDVGP